MRAQIRRRDFLTLLGGATAVAWPMAARAQQRPMPVIGYLYTGTAEPTAHLLAAFRRGLGETGYIEGQNVAIEYRWAENQNDRLPELAADLVQRRVAVIITPISVGAALAAQSATTTIPIVFGTGADPVRVGLVATLNRPGGNVTGIVSYNNELAAKQLGLLHELVPGAARFALLANPNNPSVEESITNLRAAALTIGAQIEIVSVGTTRDIDTVFATLVQKQVDALLASPDPLLTSSRAQVITLAARHRVPTIHYMREFAEAGGLMSYGSNLTDLFRQMGIYTGRILKGEKPAELPVMRPTKFEFVVNLKAAKALGLTFPPGLLAIADEVIE
jgi:putative ABC transport system substrate-binding protein